MLSRVDLLILDDWGLAPLTGEQRRDLLEVVDDRHQRGSTIITSQVPIEHWHEVIADPTIADAVLDRLVHNAHRLALEGDSMRKITAQRANLDAAKKNGPNSSCRQRHPGRLRRNRWPPSIGLHGRVQSESLAAIPGISEASNGSRVTEVTPCSARDRFEAGLNEAACCWLSPMGVEGRRRARRKAAAGSFNPQSWALIARSRYSWVLARAAISLGLGSIDHQPRSIKSGLAAPA